MKDSPIAALAQIPAGAEVFCPIWTTAPYTIPTNAAVAVNPELEYVVLKATEGERSCYYIVCKSRVNDLIRRIGESEYDDVRMTSFAMSEGFLGAQLENIRYKRPMVMFGANTAPVLTASFVTDENGTGLVHISPANGFTDYELGKKHNLPSICVGMFKHVLLIDFLELKTNRFNFE